MASASLGNGGIGSSSRSAAALRAASSASSSVDWLGREMLHMNLNRDHDHDDDDEDDARESEPDIIDGVGAETGHVIRTSIAARNGQSKQVSLIFSIISYWKTNSCPVLLLCHHFSFSTSQNVSYIAEHVVGTGSFGTVFQVSHPFACFSYRLQMLCCYLSIYHTQTSFFRLNVEKQERLLPSRRFSRTSVTRTESYRLCKCSTIQILSPSGIVSFQPLTKRSFT